MFAEMGFTCSKFRRLIWGQVGTRRRRWSTIISPSSSFVVSRLCFCAHPYNVIQRFAERSVAWCLTRAVRFVIPPLASSMRCICQLWRRRIHLVRLASESVTSLSCVLFSLQARHTATYHLCLWLFLKNFNDLVEDYTWPSVFAPTASPRAKDAKHVVQYWSISRIRIPFRWLRRIASSRRMPRIPAEIV